MADPNGSTCAACGARGELHEHHLVPRVDGGADLPTVLLCISCHGLVHGRTFSLHHAELTRRGLSAAKARGVKLGNPNLQPGNGAAFAAAGRRTQTARSRRRAEDVMPFIVAAQRAGCASLREVAQALTARGIPTPGGAVHVWHPAQVSRVIKRTSL